MNRHPSQLEILRHVHDVEVLQDNLLKQMTLTDTQIETVARQAVPVLMKFLKVDRTIAQIIVQGFVPFDIVWSRTTIEILEGGAFGLNTLALATSALAVLFSISSAAPCTVRNQGITSTQVSVEQFVNLQSKAIQSGIK